MVITLSHIFNQRVSICEQDHKFLLMWLQLIPNMLKCLFIQQWKLLLLEHAIFFFPYKKKTICEKITLKL